MKKRQINSKKTQAGVEYMIIIGFVTLAIMAVLTLAYLYSGLIKDRIRINQVETFAIQLINAAESVYFAGEPSETTVSLYLPDGVKTLGISSDYILISTQTSSGENKRAFKSRVPIQGSISAGEGVKKLLVQAEATYVSISQA